MGARPHVIRQHREVVFAQFHVRKKPQLAARVSLDDRAPEIKPLVTFAGIHSQVAGLDQLAGGAILNHRTSRRARLGILRRLTKRKRNSHQAPKGGR
jgi:hypothetical protein